MSVSKPRASLTATEVRRAFVHFAELALAFEGGGIEVVLVGEDGAQSADDDETQCLEKVTALLLKSLDAQREQQGRNLTARLHEGLTEVYKRFKDDPDAVDLDAEATRLITEQGLQVQAEDLDELVIGRFDLTAGPSVTAAKTAEAVVGAKSRTIFKYRQLRSGPAHMRAAQGHWVPLRLAKRYAVNVFDEADTARRAPQTATSADLRDRTPAFFEMLERQAEAEYRKLVRELMEFAFLGDLEHPPEVAERLDGIRVQRKVLRDQIRAVVADRAAAHGESLADHELERRLVEEYEGAVEWLITQQIRNAGVE